jgi:hypothetical protein
LILGGTALVAGAVLAFAPYSVPARDLVGPSHLLSRRLETVPVHCDRPISGAFFGLRGEWINYATTDSRASTGTSLLTRVPCPTSARWRLGGGAMLAIGGVAALVIWTRQSRLGGDDGDGVGDDGDDEVGGAGPPSGAGSPDPSPGGPSPS